MCWKSTIVLSTPKPAFFHVSFGCLFRFWPILKLRSQVLVLCSFVRTKRQVYSINFFYLSEWNPNPVISMWHWNGKRDLSHPCCRMQPSFSVIHHPLTVNAKYKNAMQNAKMQCKTQWGLTSTVLSTSQVNWSIQAHLCVRHGWACGSVLGHLEQEDAVVGFWFTGLVSS